MVLALSVALGPGFGVRHIIPDTTDPATEAERTGGVQEPANAKLEIGETEELLGREVVQERRPFGVWWSDWAKVRAEAGKA